MSKNNKGKKFIFFADVPPNFSGKSLDAYVACGFDTYLMTEDHICYEDNPKGYCGTLNLLKEKGLKVLMRGYNDGREIPDYFKKFEGMDFHDYDNIIGLYMVDEPFIGDMTALKEHCIPLYQPYNDLLWHINLLPSYTPKGALMPTDEEGTPDRETFWKIETSSTGEATSAEVEGIAPFEYYINEYIETVLKNVDGPKDICFDHYPLFEKDSVYYISDTWLYDLYVVASAAKEHGVRLGSCVQAFSCPGWRILKSQDEIRFQLYTQLAFGVNIFEFFYYCPLASIPEGTPLFVDGKMTEVYDYCKSAIAEIKKLDAVYEKFEWQGIYLQQGKDMVDSANYVHIENGSCSEFGVKWKYNKNPAFEKIGKKALSELQMITVKNRKDIVIGEFKNNSGEYGYMIVNFADPALLKNNTIEIEVKDKKRITLINKGMTFHFVENQIIFDLQPGDGAFVIISES